jgi:hypothetical protein
VSLVSTSTVGEAGHRNGLLTSTTLSSEAGMACSRGVGSRAQQTALIGGSAADSSSGPAQRSPTPPGVLVYFVLVLNIRQPD